MTTVLIKKSAIKTMLGCNQSSLKIALFLKSVADPKNIINIKIEEIIEALGYTKKTIVTSLSELKKKGLIKIHKNIPYPNSYEVLF